MTLCLAGNTIQVRPAVALLLVELPERERRGAGRRLLRLQEALRRVLNIPNGFYASAGACGSTEEVDLPWNDLDDLGDGDLGD